MRLTPAIKKHIINAAIEKAGFSEKREALLEEYAAIAEAVRLISVGGEENDKKLAGIIKRHNTRAKNFPEGLFTAPIRQGIGVHVNAGGEAHFLHFCGAYRPYNDSKRAPVVKTTAPEVTLPVSHPLAVRLSKAERNREGLHEEMDELSATVAAALCGYRTVAKLVAAWPEAKELLPEEDTESACLPAIPVADLNAVIGLPTQKN